MALQSMQLFHGRSFAFSSNGIAKSGIGSNPLLVFEVTHEAKS